MTHIHACLGEVGQHWFSQRRVIYWLRIDNAPPITEIFKKQTFVFKEMLLNLPHVIQPQSRTTKKRVKALQWCHDGRDGVSNHQPHDCLLNGLFRRRSRKTPKLRVTGLCAEISPVTGEFLAQRANNAENVSIWWRHHGLLRARS